MKNKEFILQQCFSEYNGSDLEYLLVTNSERKKDFLVVYIHGFNTFGAWEKALFLAPQVIKEGWAFACPSQPGFGYSQGKRDYCGPLTISTIAKAIQELTEENNLSAERIVVWGVSRGAIITAQLAGKYPDIAGGFICQSGAYDFERDYNFQGKSEVIKTNMREESGGSKEAFRERSAIEFVSAIKGKILIIHGNKDETINVEQASLFAEKLKKYNKDYVLEIVDGGHDLNPGVRRQIIWPFIKNLQ